MRGTLKNILNSLPYLRGLNYQIQDLQLKVDEYNKNSCFPPGHFYSPIVSVEKVKENEREIWKAVSSNRILGVDLNTEEQVSTLKQLARFYSEMPFKPKKVEGLRYYFDNEYYCYTDAILLYSMVRYFKPKKIIEVGSGFSSAVILDTNQLFLDNNVAVTFIEPYPERLYSLLEEADKNSAKVFVQDLQKVDITYFDTLEANDVLLIDSTHISKTGSDVNYILFQILPRLKKGVLIHFHDIFYPFEYPKDWVYMGRNWNEDYIIRAFLMYNNAFKIKLFADYLHTHQNDVFSEMPLCYKNTGGCLWIQKQ
jgi:predicted O-methyltransferase YrrM